MKLKRVGRSGSVVALVAASLGASIVLTPASASADSAWWCYGTQVKRCATVWWDDATDTYQARAKITDVAGGNNYSVKVTNVKLQRFNGSGWVTVKSKQDYDGWFATEDSAATAKVDPCAWPTNSFGVVATFSYKGASSGETTWRPGNSWAMLCD
ncbi:hypothetical protein [Streptomyces sp. NBC_00059]|uniref:hypothetical protein n=1 Tax=Streptomyces sp. NBC_00059 TaxID=2975635 RepID=UPI00225B69A6|nr:hypothetical protein [Streptomyces sp. NBC_00059]MCX5412324.1 hypothetical protein [Streptomyces sp. NBC_00059]